MHLIRGFGHWSLLFLPVWWMQDCLPCHPFSVFSEHRPAHVNPQDLLSVPCFIIEIRKMHMYTFATRRIHAEHSWSYWCSCVLKTSAHAVTEQKPIVLGIARTLNKETVPGLENLYSKYKIEGKRWINWQMQKKLPLPDSKMNQHWTKLLTRTSPNPIPVPSLPCLLLQFD